MPHAGVCASFCPDWGNDPVLSSLAPLSELYTSPGGGAPVVPAICELSGLLNKQVGW